MMDDTPYLIVDDLKLTPIRRVNRIDPIFRNRTLTPKDTLGIADRVTISSEARQMARQTWAKGALLSGANTLVPVHRQRSQSSASLLTYPRNLSKWQP